MAGALSDTLGFQVWKLNKFLELNGPDVDFVSFYKNSPAGRALETPGVAPVWVQMSKQKRRAERRGVDRRGYEQVHQGAERRGVLRHRLPASPWVQVQLPTFSLWGGVGPPGEDRHTSLSGLPCPVVQAGNCTTAPVGLMEAPR